MKTVFPSKLLAKPGGIFLVSKDFDLTQAQSRRARRRWVTDDKRVWDGFKSMAYDHYKIEAV